MNLQKQLPVSKNPTIKADLKNLEKKELKDIKIKK